MHLLYKINFHQNQILELVDNQINSDSRVELSKPLLLNSHRERLGRDLA